MLTGYATGSLYRTHKDKLALFSDLAVGDGIKDSRVLLINTHHAFNKVPKAFQIPFERAILLIRNPYDTVKANYDYKKTKSYHKSVDMKELLTEGKLSDIPHNYTSVKSGLITCMSL